MSVPDRLPDLNLDHSAAAFRAEGSNVKSSPAPATGQHPSGPMAERRQLSIMFCDLVESTALSSRLDPEDFSALIRDYQSRVVATIQRFGGFIARYVGDGLLIYFGWPAACETNAEQAVRAAIAVIDAIGRTPVRTESLQVRIGIATGLVVIGEPIGMGEARQQTAIGVAPNLAARLQGLADPNSVVIDAVTYRQIDTLFKCRDLGSVVLKGLSEQVQVWQVTEQRAARSRSEALHSAVALPPLVGREQELELLLRCWNEAKGGQGRVVLLSGEPGIGKSRLVAGLMEQLTGEPHTELRYFCSPQYQDSPLFPIVAQIERTAGFERNDPLDIKLAKTQALLAGASAHEQDIAPITELMGLVDSDRTVPAREWRERLFDALAGQLASLAARQPVVMLFEDAQWIDPTSLELLSLIIARMRRWPVLLVTSFRPGFRPQWTGLPHVEVLVLSGLRRRESRSVAARAAGSTALPASLIEQIIERTEGVPLYIEELTRAVVETNWHDANIEKAALRSALPGCAIPATLYASLAARLDRLAAVRDVAQIAAAIGREFPVDLLAAVTLRPQEALQDALARLVDAGLISHHGTASRKSYVFKHALIRDVAYSMLLLDERRRLHARIAEVISQRFPEQVESVPELLARHYMLAGLIEPAVRHLLAAGRRGFRASAYREAASHLEKGMKLLDRLPEGVQRTRLKLDLKASLGLVRDASRGYGHMFQPVFATWRGRTPWNYYDAANSKLNWP